MGPLILLGAVAAFFVVGGMRSKGAMPPSNGTVGKKPAPSGIQNPGAKKGADEVAAYADAASKWWNVATDIVSSFKGSSQAAGDGVPGGGPDGQ